MESKSIHKKKKLIVSAIVPCYNEEDNLFELAERINLVFKSKKITGEIILVDDGSQDNTWAVIQQLSKKYRNIKKIKNPINKGITYSWRIGLEQTEGKYVCLIDADLQYQPEDIYRLHREIEWSRVDLVQGWRSSIGRVKGLRYFYSIVLNRVLNVLFKMHAKDNKSGFILCRRNILEDILTTRFKYKYFQTFVTVAAKFKGYSIKEVEILFEKRILGKPFISKFPMKIIGWTLVDLLKAFGEYRVLKVQKIDDLVLVEFLKRARLKKKKEKIEFWRQIYLKLYALLMPFHHWMIDKKAVSDYFYLKKSQWLKPEQIRELQFIKLKKVLSHAYNHVEFYRERFERLKITPDDIRSFNDFQKLPFLTKNDIRKNLLFDLFSDNHDKNEVLKVTTSGSTGEPLAIYVDKKQLNIRWATTLRGMEMAGYQFGDKQVRLWHQTIGMSRKQILKEKLDAFLSRRLFISSYEMTRINLAETVKKIRDYQPMIISGYAESFDLIANYLKLHPIKGVISRGIISSAQMLSKQSRKIIEKSFNCQVFDKYGSREFSGIAYECNAHQGRHLSAESYLVELIKDGRLAQPGEMGEVIITDLNNFCVPLIRYRIGDLAEQIDNTKVCPCGRGLPRIGEIKGRTQAIIIGSDGQYVPGTFFAHLLKDYSYAVKQFQIIQTKLGEIEIKMVKGKRFNEKTFKEILFQIRKYLGKNLKMKVRFVESISLGRTGKRQHSISKLNIDFQKLG